MYPVHHPTLKIEQAERHREAARLRLAASAPGRRRWSLAAWLGSSPTPDGAPAPAVPMPAPAQAPVHPPAVETIGDDDRVLVGR